MDKTCKNFEKCPIYSGILKNMEFTARAYRVQYCDAGYDGWKTCKRYQVKERVGKCPDGLLPNSKKSVDEIIRKYNLRPPLGS